MHVMLTYIDMMCCFSSVFIQQLKKFCVPEEQYIIDNAEDGTIFHYLLNDEKLQSKT